MSEITLKISDISSDEIGLELILPDDFKNVESTTNAVAMGFICKQVIEKSMNPEFRKVLLALLSKYGGE